MNYLYFTFDGISSNKYNLTIQNSGEDLSFPSQPGFENQIISPLYQGTNFLAGVNKKERSFNFNCWVDSLTTEKVRSMLEWLSPDKVGYLILDYNPNYQYRVKLAAISDFKHMAINTDDTVNYEFTLSFTTIGDFAATSRTTYKINQKTNPIGSVESTFLNSDNLAPIGIWDAATSKFKFFNYGSEPTPLKFTLANTLTFDIQKSDVIQYNYSSSAMKAFVVDSKYGFCKIGNNLAETDAQVTVNNNVGPSLMPSGNTEILYTTIDSYAAPTITLAYDEDLLSFTDMTNLYMVVQDGDYGLELAVGGTYTQQELLDEITGINSVTFTDSEEVI